MKDQPETCPCKFCGEPTVMLGTRLCDSCWEIDHRIDRFLKSEKGREFIEDRLNASKKWGRT